VFVFAASIWEVAIKASLGKIEADPDALIAAIDASGFTALPVRSAHAAGVTRLAPYHNDPFDRLLIAQALAEPLTLLTADALLVRYSDLVALV
jgi:PIN domain nuclease of toxin-antitoxin system